MIRFCSLGSGSAGNACVVEASSGITTTRLLIDAGFSLRVLEARLDRAGLRPDDLDAVFVTHEHGDHVGCAIALARRFALPLWTSRGTWRTLAEDASGLDLRFARDGQAIGVGDIEVRPFTVAHDAAEPLQLSCSDGSSRLVVLTDLGSITEHTIRNVAACDALIVECNHDPTLLAASRYPPSLKARIGGRLGHLSNRLAGDVLAAADSTRLRRVVAAHLSRENNRAETARQALAERWGSGRRDIVVADQALGFDWLNLA